MITYEVSICCDRADCPNRVSGGTELAWEDSAAKARVRARKQGWLQVMDQFYCPDHHNDYRLRVHEMEKL